MKFSYENSLLAFLILLLIYSLDTTFSRPKIEKKSIQKAETIKKTIIKKTTSIEKKKENFKNLVIPTINKVYNELYTQYETIAQSLDNNDTYTQEIADLKKIYKVQSDEELLMALKPHPISIAIAQAAMESAWGSSRFFKEANNLYGIWSFNKNKPRIAASQKRGYKTIWLKKYSSIEESIRDYYKTVARSSAYKEFRKLKMQTTDPYLLVEKLDKYSEIGAKYAQDLKKIIRYNKFDIYDR